MQQQTRRRWAPFNRQAHGEGFLALYQHRFEDGVYLLDEPEAALSPNRQLRPG